MGVLYLICGGAPPTADVGRAVPQAQRQGWDVWVIATPQAMAFLDVPLVEKATTHAVRSTFRLPDEPRLPEPAAVLAAPLTFSSLNKWAAGIADTYALGAFTEAIGDGTPVVAVPWAKAALTSHPAFGRSVELLRSLGATVVVGRDSSPMLPDLVVSDFPWRLAISALPTR